MRKDEIFTHTGGKISCVKGIFTGIFIRSETLIVVKENESMQWIIDLKDCRIHGLLNPRIVISKYC